MARVERCSYPKCRNYPDITYIDKPLCEKHWLMIDSNPGLLRKRLGLPAFPKKKFYYRRVMGRLIKFRIKE